jgi:nickel superoxide dismutase
MAEQIMALPQDMPPTLATRNTFVRMTQVKEEHAQLCKKELLILWTDFFKPEHLEKFPELHEIFWRAAKLCSKNKQEVNPELSQQLVEAVDEIAKIFYTVKEAPERFEAYKTITDKLY